MNPDGMLNSLPTGLLKLPGEEERGTEEKDPHALIH